MLTGQEITGIEVWAVGWMIKHLPAELLQETCCSSSRVWSSVIVQEDNPRRQTSTTQVFRS
jgi:hypothetical protein